MNKIIIFLSLLVLINSVSCFSLFSFFSFFDKPAYKLTYFNIRGRGEFLRYMFAYAAQNYTDDRVEQADWPKLKPNMPFGQLPVLEIKQGSKVDIIAQSSAIGKYLARKFDISGRNDLETSYVDMYTSQLLDLFDRIGTYNFETNMTIKEQLFNATWSTYLPFFESKLKKTNTGYLVGSTLTWADLYLSSILDNLGNRYDRVLEKFPEIVKLDKMVKSLPRIAQYLKKRPVTEM